MRREPFLESLDKCTREEVKNPHTGQYKDPDTRFMEKTEARFGYCDKCACATLAYLERNYYETDEK